MQKIILLAGVIGILLYSPEVFSQQKLKEKILAEGESRDPFDKKFRWGISYQQYWSTITGDQVEKDYFIKPSIGFNFRFEYYFNSFLGLGLGAGYQQRGAGITNLDNTGGAYAHPWITVDGVTGDPDSTHLERLRFNTIEFPLTILLRTPKDVWKGTRVSAAAGPTLIHLISVNQTYQSVVDGFHPYHWVSDNYIHNDLGYQVSIGADIDSGGSGKSMFQIHFVYTQGLKNIYAAGQGDGRQMTFGVRLGWLF
ncbi:MAG TPA: outer membrane beta-barrel protein [Cyclobacteriaceae bacterium]|nr:outer membrane beta-barrel protein [Cyclobacteriaceae bacterium]